MSRALLAYPWPRSVRSIVSFTAARLAASTPSIAGASSVKAARAPPPKAGDRSPERARFAVALDTITGRDPHHRAREAIDHALARHHVIAMDVSEVIPVDIDPLDARTRGVHVAVTPLVAQTERCSVRAMISFCRDDERSQKQSLQPPRGRSSERVSRPLTDVSEHWGGQVRSEQEERVALAGWGDDPPGARRLSRRRPAHDLDRPLARGGATSGCPPALRWPSKLEPMHVVESPFVTHVQHRVQRRRSYPQRASTPTATRRRPGSHARTSSCSLRFPCVPGQGAAAGDDADLAPRCIDTRMSPAILSTVLLYMCRRFPIQRFGGEGRYQ